MIVLKHQIGRGKKGVWFTKEDIEILKLIWDFKYLSLYQIKYYSERLYGIQPSSTERKLQKWRQCKVVLVRDYTRPPGAKMYYRVGPEGAEVLAIMGLIKNEEKSILGELSSKKFFDHFFGVRDAALLALINLRKNNRIVTSLPPNKIPYVEEKFEGDSPIVVPDWVLCNSHGFLNIELDTGSEHFAIINEKIEKYVRYSKLRPNEIHHVLFVIIDENDTDLKYITKDIPKDRSVRVSNLKDAIISLNAHIYPNLNFYVVTMSRAGEVAYKILTGEYPAPAANRSNEINSIINVLELYDKFKLEIESLNVDDFYLAEVKEELFADGHFLFRNLTTQSSETVLIKRLEEGSVKSLDQIGYLNLLKSEGRFKRKVDKILGIYRTNDELNNDVLGKMMPNILFSSDVQLANDLESYPTFFQTVNTTRKEAVRLYGSKDPS